MSCRSEVDGRLGSVSDGVLGVVLRSSERRGTGEGVALVVVDFIAVVDVGVVVFVSVDVTVGPLRFSGEEQRRVRFEY